MDSDTLAALRYPQYHSYMSQAISELGAIGAPTRELVSPPLFIYGVLLAAFAVGVWSAAGKWTLRVIALLLLGIALTGWFTPPMHLRGTGDISADAPHIIGTSVIVFLILVAVVLGVSLFGRRFRLYCWATLLTLIGSGTLTYVAAGQLAAGQPTPWLGLVERINVGAYLLWVAVLAFTLLQSPISHPRVTELRSELRPAA